MSDKKPRTFTLHLLDGYFVEGPTLSTKNTLGVVDAAAYAQLQKEKEELKDKLYHATRNAETKWYEQNEDLKLEIARCREIAERDGKDYSDLLAKLKLAVEALEFYKDVKNYTKDGIVFSAQPCGYAEFEQVQDFGITAEQALAKIKSKGELCD